MKHLGDITKIKDAPVVDCVIGGSPCQDLSVAGKRKGLAGERSGLFMEQIRIIKEMRQKDEASGRTGVDIRPRYMVWENVPGTFSSKKGEDFLAVLEEVCRVVDPDVSIPRPAGGKWSCAGCIMADGYSVAWRVHDAQFFGVPQRRRRIALVADFGGRSAPEILFERSRVSRDTQPNDEAGQGSAETALQRLDPAISFQERAGCEGGVKGYSSNTTEREHCQPSTTNSCAIDGYNAAISDNSPTLGVNCGTSTGRCGVLEKKCYGISAYESNCMKSDNPNSGIYEADTARTLDNNGGNPSCNQGGTIVVEREMVFDARGNGDGAICPTITGDHQNRVTDYTAWCIGNGQADNLGLSEKAGTLNCMSAQQAVITIDRAAFNQGKNAQYKPQIKVGQTADTVVSKGPGAVFQKYKFIRRFTPLECERLQGFPDNWTDIGDWVDSKGKKRKTSDANRYKALGNSIALPFWRWLTKQISSQYAYTPTMASLFDGIGGFPLLWEEVNGKGTAIWASEIEEFPIAVTKYHFGED